VHRDHAQPTAQDGTPRWTMIRTWTIVLNVAASIDRRLLGAPHRQSALAGPAIRAAQKAHEQS
jgi:hypothetical protein